MYMRAFLKRFWWAGLIVVGLVLVIGAMLFFSKDNIDKNEVTKNDSSTTGETKDKEKKIEWPSADAKYITAVPLDLTQILSISKYRGCAGHDFSGYSFEQTPETDRSMKHYIYPVAQFQGTINKVKMLAPFDGTVSSIDLESDQIGQPGKRPQTGNGITFSTPADPNVGFEFSHIYFVKEFKVGDVVKGGELIGYAALGDKGNDFDLVLSGPRMSNSSIFGSVFDHMTESVLGEFAAHGVTIGNTKFTKEYRDANPCGYAAGTQKGGRPGESWTQLTP